MIVNKDDRLRGVRWMGIACVVVVGTSATELVLAEPPPPRETLIPSPGRSIAGNDQSSAIATNPANLAFLPTWEARWTWVRTGDASAQPGRGHAFNFALPLLGRVGTGLRLDFGRPGEQAFPIDRRYTWLTWGVGIKAQDAFSVGFSIQHAYSREPELGGATGFTLAASARPSPYFGLSIVGRNLNAPSTQRLRQIDSSVDVGVAIRPTGRRELEIGIEDQYLDGSGQWLPRATLGIDVPYVGRVRGDITTSDPTLPGRTVYAATAGLELGWGTTTAEAGGIFGSELGGKDGAGFYAGAAFSGSRSPGLPEGGYGLKIRIEETPSARGHVHLLRQLWKLARDKELRAVAFVLKTEPSGSMAHAEELGDAIRMLRANGKKVICHVEDAQARALYVCSQADRVVINPAGLVRFAGLKASYMYYASLLDKLGIRAQFIRIGAHKSAPEAFMRDSATDVARADHLDMLQEYDDVFTSDIAGGRHIPRSQLQAIFATGPFLAAEAVQNRLVDGVAFDDEVNSTVDDVVGHHVPLRDEPRPPRTPERFGAQKKVAIIYVDGDMVDGKSRDVPLIGTRLVGSYTIAKALKDARENPMIGAVVLRVESPGGSSVAADVMWREAMLTAKAKPFVVSMGTYAASGGYYIATAGSKVFANPLTVTGSIGIFYGKADVSELLKKIGVSVETYKMTPRADGESIYRPYTPEELAILQTKVRQLYDIFVSRVAEGRHMNKDAVDAVAQGRVWTGREAAARHLVDQLGGIREAIEEAEHLAGLPADAPIDELPVPQESLLDVALKLAGVSEQPSLGGTPLLPAQLVSLVRAMAPFTVYDSDTPLARLEVVPLDQP